MLLTCFSKNISIYAIFIDQSFNNMLTNHIVSFEKLGPNHFSFISDNFAVILGLGVGIPVFFMAVLLIAIVIIYVVKVRKRYNRYIQDEPDR